MSKGRKEQSVQNIEDIQVELKPFGGLTPRVYVPVAWALLIAAVVFLLLILPGIRRNGTVLTVHTNPPDASVYFNGERLGPSGKEVFASKGTGELIIKAPGFEDFRTDFQVKGRVLASRVFPRRDSISVNLKAESGTNFIDSGLAEYAAWALTGPEKDRYAIPASLTSAARKAVAAGFSADMSAFIASGLLASQDERQWADLLRSVVLLSSKGVPTSPSSVAVAVDTVFEFIDKNPEVLNELVGQVGESFEAYASLETPTVPVLGQYKTYYEREPGGAFPSNMTVGGVTFYYVEGGSYALGDIEIAAAGYNPRYGAEPTFSNVDEFYISRQEVSNDDFEAFVRTNPRWSPENRSQLIHEGLVDEGYLNDWSASGAPAGSGNDPVVRVSWHAAQAYSAWFNEKYLTGSGYRSRLPKEFEWEAAARINGTPESTGASSSAFVNASEAADGLGPVLGLTANAREWCQGSFFLSEYRFPSLVMSDVNKMESASVGRPVRGGAFIDDSLPYPVAARGSLPAETTSPVIGFRIILVES